MYELRIWQFELGVVPEQRPGQQWHGSGSQDCKGLNRDNFVNIF